MGQGHLTVTGKLRVDGGNLDNSKMVVYKDGEKQRTITTDLNKFSLEMDLGATYVLSFEKNGFVTKSLSFNTRVPVSEGATPFMPFTFIVSLFKQYEGVNTIVFNQPVGMIRYDSEQEEFDYDTDYTKSIQSALEEAQAAIEKKQKEETEAAAAEAKRAAQADKEKAKEDARLAKAAAEKAKEDARLAREATEKAKEEARLKKEADDRAAREAKLAVQEPAPRPEPPSPPKAEPKPPKKPEPVPAPAPKPVPPPPPAPRTVEVPRPAKPKPVLSPARPTHLADPTQGKDERGSTAPRMVQEASPVQYAAVRTASEPRPKFEAAPSVPVRHKDVVVEPGQVITVVRVEQDGVANEYRKVVRKYSGTYYFKDGSSCSRDTYEREALTEAGR